MFRIDVDFYYLFCIVFVYDDEIDVRLDCVYID